MNRLSTAIIVAATMLAASTEGFTTAPPAVQMQTMRRTRPVFATDIAESPQVKTTSPQHEEHETNNMASASAEKKPTSKAAKTSAGAGAHGKKGIFAPLVLIAKKTLGEAKLNEIRGKAIGAHSKVIKSFVDTHESAIGETALRTLFTLTDMNKNGSIEQEELAAALKRLGFDLKDKQIQSIFERADADGNGALDFDEWKREMPATLRTNLVKLAKKNGGDLGFLV